MQIRSREKECPGGREGCPPRWTLRGADAAATCQRDVTPGGTVVAATSRDTARHPMAQFTQNHLPLSLPGLPSPGLEDGTASRLHADVIAPASARETRR